MDTGFAVQELLSLILIVGLISVFWSWGLCILSSNVLGRKNKAGTCVRYIGIFSSIQPGYILLAKGLPYTTLMLEIGLFSLQSAILVEVLYRARERSVKIISAVSSGNADRMLHKQGSRPRRWLEQLPAHFG